MQHGNHVTVVHKSHDYHIEKSKKIWKDNTCDDRVQAHNKLNHYSYVLSFHIFLDFSM
jgi:hypothetical protein